MNSNKFLSFYFLILFIYNAASCGLFTVADWAPWFFSGIPLVVSVIVALKYDINLFDKKLLILIGILSIWNGAQYFINHIDPSPYALMLVVVAWVAYNIFHEDFVDRFIKVTTGLATMSLVVWVMSIIMPSMMQGIGKNYGIETMDVSYSFLLFNINKSNSLRNCGFSWEPGRYSCILLIALYFYYEKYGLKIRSKSFYILFLSLLSTVSTTGIIALFVFLFYILFKTKKLNPVYWIPVIAIASIVWSLPFMSGKIKEFGYSDDKFDESVSNMEWMAQHNAKSAVYSPQRFDGLAFQWMNVQHMNPIIGDSHNFTKFYINKDLNFNIVASEGILFQILCYGLLIGFLSYFCLYKSSKYWGARYGGNDTWLFFILFLVINFSYNFWEFPLYMVIWLWSYFENSHQKISIV